MKTTWDVKQQHNSAQVWLSTGTVTASCPSLARITVCDRHGVAQPRALDILPWPLIFAASQLRERWEAAVSLPDGWFEELDGKFAQHDCTGTTLTIDESGFVDVHFLPGVPASVLEEIPEVVDFFERQAAERSVQ